MSPPSSYMFKFHLFVILYEKTTKQDRIYDRIRIFIIQSNMTLNLKFVIIEGHNILNIHLRHLVRNACMIATLRENLVWNANIIATWRNFQHSGP